MASRRLNASVGTRNWFLFCRPKELREALGLNWKRRIKGMLFFDWNFPISNNKLKLKVGWCSCCLAFFVLVAGYQKVN